ncbi:MAG TPA: hypothetical protein VNK95_03065 [Caldilineaceae bacterium]|nr:hypothetical protein [Caldilineaceae bacterium]
MSETLQILQELANRPAAREWVQQVVSYVRLQVTDTNEEFTVICRPAGIEVVPGFRPPDRRPILFGLFDPGKWYAEQFIIPLTSENIRNFAGFFTDDTLDEQELYRVMAFIAPRLLQATLRMPVMRNRLLLALLRLDTAWHQCLLDPAGNETQQATVRFINGQWEILEGYQGVAQRKKVLTAPSLLEFQRRVHQAEVENTLAGWLALHAWYKQWLAARSG